ncbi:MAG TPA: stage 0 sporulation family protein [Desulfobacterales bacterium]|nr:stage 0 sporulation family protein [Desulfobacterales bacterium]
MKKIVKVRFKPAGKVYDFESGAFVLNPGDHIIVETEQGLAFGTVVAPPAAYDDESSEKILKKVFRLANENDLEQLKKNHETEKHAYAFCLECIKELELKMNLFAVESTFDASKMTFFFTSEGRVDFRQLVKILVRELNVRIEMRQVGIRNQAKMCGGIGRCGRELCCASFMEKFEPVSIRMAKEQGLSLNPTKISGQCGRLMCCLIYENATYQELRSKFPKIGKNLETRRGKGKVIRHNVIGDRIAIQLDDDSEIEIGLNEILTQEEQAEK